MFLKIFVQNLLLMVKFLFKKKNKPLKSNFIYFRCKNNTNSIKKYI